MFRVKKSNLFGITRYQYEWWNWNVVDNMRHFKKGLKNLENIKLCLKILYKYHQLFNNVSTFSYIEMKLYMPLNFFCVFIFLCNYLYNPSFHYWRAHGIYEEIINMMILHKGILNHMERVSINHGYAVVIKHLFGNTYLITNRYTFTVYILNDTRIII